MGMEMLKWLRERRILDMHRNLGWYFVILLDSTINILHLLALLQPLVLSNSAYPTQRKPSRTAVSSATTPSKELGSIPNAFKIVGATCLVETL